MHRRIAAYSHDAVGLGHLRRTYAICRSLTDREPGLSALILSGSPFAQVFGSRDRIDYLTLPSARKIGNGHYESRFLDIGIGELSRLRGGVIDEGLRAFNPGLFLVDKTPAGLGGELLPCLNRLKRSNRTTRVVLGLRDILDEPETVKAEWSRDGLWELVREFYDEVWIYGQPDLFDPVSEYGFPPEIAAKTTFVGYLPNYNGVLSKETVSRELALDGRRLVVVTAGGGEDGFSMFDHYLKGLERSGGPDNTLHCLVTGPGLSPDEHDLLGRRAQRPNVHFAAFSSMLTSFFAAADLVVTMGGYNSLTEILSLGRRAIVVPRVVPRTEQLIRAERLARRGLVSLVLPAAVQSGGLLDVVERELNRAPLGAAPQPLGFDGHNRIEQRFRNLVSHVPEAPPSAVKEAPASNLRTAGCVAPDADAGTS